jgi:hypothetical protein
MASPSRFQMHVKDAPQTVNYPFCDPFDLRHFVVGAIKRLFTQRSHLPG